MMCRCVTKVISGRCTLSAYTLSSVGASADRMCGIQVHSFNLFCDVLW